MTHALWKEGAMIGARKTFIGVITHSKHRHGLPFCLVTTMHGYWLCLRLANTTGATVITIRRVSIFRTKMAVASFNLSIRDLCGSIKRSWMDRELPQTYQTCSFCVPNHLGRPKNSPSDPLKSSAENKCLGANRARPLVVRLGSSGTGINYISIKLRQSRSIGIQIIISIVWVSKHFSNILAKCWSWVEYLIYTINLGATNNANQDYMRINYTLMFVYTIADWSIIDIVHCHLLVKLGV
jgi:hypothetical protein